MINSRIPEANRGYEDERDVYPLPSVPRVEICQECNEPIIDGQASCHKAGCKSNQEIEF